MPPKAKKQKIGQSQDCQPPRTNASANHLSLSFQRHTHSSFPVAFNNVHSIVRSTTTTTTVSVVTSTTAAAAPPSTPLSAVAARRQQLLELANKSTLVTPETEEHLEVDNVDVDEEEKASLDSNESGDSDSNDASDQSEEEDSGTKPTAKEAIAAAPQYERRDRK